MNLITIFTAKILPLNTKRIVITGGPGTGKSSIINELIKRGFTCHVEISRDIILEAQKQGIEQLFLTNPLYFSERLLEGRKQQYLDALENKANPIFFDRGIPDIVAYMDFKEEGYSPFFIDACKNYRYDYVFILKPWKEIYKVDNERYEDFNQATQIYQHLLRTYQKYEYKLLDVPFDTISNRTDYIINTLKNLQ
jgi:predicted ATPase